MPKEYPWGKGTPVWVRDATANDSDKSFTVPAGKVWDLKSVNMKLVTTATVGNRVMRVRVKPDGTNHDMLESVGSNAAASSTTLFWDSFGGQVSSLQTAAVFHTWPVMLLPAGAVVQCVDTAAIDAAADDLTVVLHYVEYDA